MRNKGPFWLTKLNNKTFSFINLILLALIYIVGLIFMLTNLGINSVIKSLANLIIIMLIIYILNLAHAFFILKIRNRMIFKKSYYINIITNSLLVVILLPNMVLWWLLPLAALISYGVAYYVNKMAKEKLVHFSVLTLAIVYLVKMIMGELITPSLWLNINNAQMLSILSIIGLLIMLILKLVKSKLITNYLIFGLGLGILLYLFKINELDLVLNNAIIFIGVFILLDNEVTPITGRAIILTVLMLIIGLGLLLVYANDYLLLGLLTLILIFNLIRKKLDIWLLPVNKK